MACTELYALLNKIVTLLDENTPSFRDSYGDWTRETKGNIWFLERTVTYETTSLNLDFVIPTSMNMLLVEQVWDDTTTKNFVIERYTSVSSSLHSDWNKITGSEEDSEVYLFTDGGLYMPSSSKLRIAQSNTTVGKTTKVSIVAEVIR